jgi:hypothetical protein
MKLNRAAWLTGMVTCFIRHVLNDSRAVGWQPGMLLLLLLLK